MYGVPSTPLGRTVVVIVKPLVTVMERTTVAVCGTGLESCACTVKLVVPAAVGVPVMTPATLMVRPTGKELPLASEYVYGRTPPVAETLAV